MRIGLHRARNLVGKIARLYPPSGEQRGRLRGSPRHACAEGGLGMRAASGAVALSNPGSRRIAGRGRALARGMSVQAPSKVVSMPRRGAPAAAAG